MSGQHGGVATTCAAVMEANRPFTRVESRKANMSARPERGGSQEAWECQQPEGSAARLHLAAPTEAPQLASSRAAAAGPGSTFTLDNELVQSHSTSVQMKTVSKCLITNVLVFKSLIPPLCRFSRFVAMATRLLFSS